MQALSKSTYLCISCLLMVLSAGSQQWHLSGNTGTPLATLHGKVFRGEWYNVYLNFHKSPQFRIEEVFLIAHAHVVLTKLEDVYEISSRGSLRLGMLRNCL